MCVQKRQSEWGFRWTAVAILASMTALRESSVWAVASWTRHGILGVDGVEDSAVDFSGC